MSSRSRASPSSELLACQVGRTGGWCAADAQSGSPSGEPLARTAKLRKKKQTSKQMNKTIIKPTKNHSLIIIFSFSLLTHDFHDSVSQEGSTALQVAEAFDIQRPHVGGGVAVGHPLCQVPAQKHSKRPLLLHSQSHLTYMPCTCQRATPQEKHSGAPTLTCQHLLQTPGQMSSSRPARSSRRRPESRPSGSACRG